MFCLRIIRGWLSRTEKPGICHRRISQGRPRAGGVPVVQALRGIASFAVCGYHFTAWNVSVPQGWVKSSGLYGYLGVEAFFVISGFIVPYSLFAGGYQLPSFFRFLGKRIVRVDPPYVASILLSLAAAWVAGRMAGHTGTASHYSLVSTGASLGVPDSLSAHQVWINGVYWTLAVEFQYYLALALLFPALTSSKAAVRRVCFAAALGASLLNRNPEFLPRSIPLFLLGLAGMEFVCHMIDRREFALMAAVCGGMAMYTAGVGESCVGMAAIACILSFRSAPKWLLASGNISYSLYLIDVPVGIRVENLAHRFIPARAVSWNRF